jgi:hypothetical protein
LELFPEGITVENFETFLKGSDIYIAVIDLEKGKDVKAMTSELLQKYNIPLFSCGAVGFGTLMVNHHPKGMMQEEFWQKIRERSEGSSTLMHSYLLNFFPAPVMDRLKKGFSQGTLATTSIGGLSSNALLASEVIAWILRDTKLVQRKIIFAPYFATMDMLGLSFTCANVDD